MLEPQWCCSAQLTVMQMGPPIEKDGQGLGENAEKMGKKYHPSEGIRRAERERDFFSLFLIMKLWAKCMILKKFSLSTDTHRAVPCDN